MPSPKQNISNALPHDVPAMIDQPSAEYTMPQGSHPQIMPTASAARSVRMGSIRAATGWSFRQGRMAARSSGRHQVYPPA